MPKITTAILPQKFEFLRDRIAEILIDEVASQSALNSDEEIDAVIAVENQGPNDKVDFPFVNVFFNNADYGNKNQGSADGTYQYFIDVYCNAPASKKELGATVANRRLQRLLGVIRSILENPIYKTLGVSPPYLSRTFVSNIAISAPNKDDALNTAMGRLTFNVVAPETTSLIVPSLIAGYDTTIKIGNTNCGYFYQGNNY